MRFLSIVACVALACVSVSAANSRARKHKARSHTAARTAPRSLRSGYSAKLSPRGKRSSPMQGSRASLRQVSQKSAGTTNSASSRQHTTARRQKSSRRRYRAPRRHSQMAPTADRITEIQSALARTGYYTGDPSGKWDGSTVEALQKFQSANGLDSTGKLDALSLQKLGLGSDVAGVSRPKGVVFHSCCSISPSPSIAPSPSVPVRGSSGLAASPKSATAANASPGDTAAAIPMKPSASAPGVSGQTSGATSAGSATSPSDSSPQPAQR